jgi:hypothetical protein
MESKITGRRTVQGKQPSNRQQSMSQQDKEHHSKHQESVVVGMFPVESYPAKVLFDTSAMHSFVSTSWIESHNIPIEPMIPPLRVNSVGGKVQFDRICPNLRIEIRG